MLDKSTIQATIDYLTGPWQAVMSAGGDIITDPADAHDSDVDFCIVRGDAVPVEDDGILDWPKRFTGDNVIELWDDVEPDQVERCWVQAQAMAAGLNAAAKAVA